MTEMRMDAIEFRHDLNPRGTLSHETVQEYARRLMNGETPAPIKVHKASGVIIDGAQRFLAYKSFYGEDWKGKNIPVELVEDCPNPDTETSLFRLYASIANRDHGLRVTRGDRYLLFSDVYDQYGQETAERYAVSLNETPESIKEWTARKERPARNADAASANTTSATPSPGFNRFGADAPPTAHLRSVRPIIKVTARDFAKVIAQAKGDFTDAEMNELLAVYEQLRVIIKGRKVSPRKEAVAQ